MKLQFCSLRAVRIGDWLVKASSLDDQILISGFNAATVDSFVEMFYCEESAYSFMEKLYDKDSEISDW